GEGDGGDLAGRLVEPGGGMQGVVLRRVQQLAQEAVTQPVHAGRRQLGRRLEGGGVGVGGGVVVQPQRLEPPRGGPPLRAAAQAPAVQQQRRRAGRRGRRGRRRAQRQQVALRGPVGGGLLAAQVQHPQQLVLVHVPSGLWLRRRPGSRGGPA